MRYPDLPFPNHTWRISHHQGILTPKLLNALLFAASTYQNSRDPSHEINTYLVTTGIVPANVREDSQQSDVWRDYQQLLPELGLIPTTRKNNRIQVNPVGLSFLDGGIGFRDLMTIQAFRSQYPNGQHTQKAAGDEALGNFAEQQAASNILIKPAVFLWQVLDAFTELKEMPSLSAAEIEHFVMPGTSHTDLEMVAESILRNRRRALVFPSGQTKQRRNASDWMKRLAQTHAFTLDGDERLTFSPWSRQKRATLTNVVRELARPEAFWIYPQDGSHAESWNRWFGVFDSRRYPIPELEVAQDYGSGPEPEDELEHDDPRVIRIKPFEWNVPDSSPEVRSLPTITSVYSADLSNSAHRLHDSMVRLIADACRRQGLEVFSDPATLDLLVDLPEQELLIEVKSATSQNLAQKIRTALGQVTYYDYLRSKQSNKPRRRGVAVTIGVSEDHWSRDFLPGYLDVDLVTLHEGRLHTFSRSESIAELLR